MDMMEDEPSSDEESQEGPLLSTPVGETEDNYEEVCKNMERKESNVEEFAGAAAAHPW